MRTWYISMVLTILVCETALASGKVDFSRYESILVRKVFGEPPAEPPPGGAAPAPAVSFVKDIRMCAITETPEFGIRVGFVDIAAKKNYYLSVGDTEDGIQLVDADYEKGAALLKKGAEEYWINMSGQVNPGSSGPAQFGPAGSPPSAVSAPPPSGAVPERTSYADRVRARQEAMARRVKEKMEKAKAVNPEEQKAALNEYHMELIRASGTKGPPLPIPLTKEMDDQLVAEGVLPPLEGEGGAAEGGQAAEAETPPTAPPPAQ